MSRRIGILGGTFDPIHQGHLDLAEAAQVALSLTSLLVIPSNVPPHRRAPVASGFHRFAMASLAVAGRATWQASDIELVKSARSYTATTLLDFHDRGYLASELFFIVGADAFADITTWKNYPQLLDYASFAVASRPGFAVDALMSALPELESKMTSSRDARQSPPGRSIILIDAKTADVSSSAIRRLRAEGQSIAGLVPPGVQQHIEQHELYTSALSSRRERDDVVNPAAGRLHGQG